MRAQIEVLSEVFAEWLRIHQLDYDYWIYSAEEWTRREGDDHHLNGAELVIAFENQLIYLFHYSDQWQVEDELQDLAGGFGYYFEFGNHWNIGFYPLEDWPTLPPQNASYGELLKDPRWANKRKRVLNRCNKQCENCGTQSTKLEIHHCYYRYGRYPWQYPDATLLALCKSCHKNRGTAELKWRGFMPLLKTDELTNLEHTLRNSLYWFDRNHLFNFLKALSASDADHIKLLKQLLESRSHPEERGSNNPYNI